MIIMIDVSIIVPVYNSEKTIKRCLDSIYTQMDCSWQVICVDDASMDASNEIIQKYAEKDKRIKLITNQKNLGAANSRNIGMNEADGRYLMNLDADDYLKPNCLVKLLRYTDGLNADICFYKAEFIFMDNASNRKIPRGIMGKYEGIYPGEILFHNFLMKDEFFYYCALVIYKNEYLKEHNLKYANLRVGEGGELIIRALIHADRAAVYPIPVYNYCIHAGSVTNDKFYKTNLLIGHVIQYVSMLEIIRGRYSEAAEKFLQRQRKLIVGAINEFNYERLTYVRDQIPNIYAKFIFDTFAAYKNAYCMLFSEEDIRKLRTFRYIYVYGSGYAAMECLCRLSDLGIRICGIVVSEKLKVRKVLCGHEVLPLEVIDTDRGQSVFVICANSVYKNEIVDLLHKHGFSNFMDLKISI